MVVAGMPRTLDTLRQISANLANTFKNGVSKVM
jgi:hypothetical protein